MLNTLEEDCEFCAASPGEEHTPECPLNDVEEDEDDLEPEQEEIEEEEEEEESGEKEPT